MAPEGAPPVIDLRALDFISPTDDNLLCSVCHCAFIRPVMTECGHIFCRECYDSASQEQRDTCPFCRSSINESDIQSAPRAMANMVDDLKVKCPYWREGCATITTRGTVQNHVSKYCDYLEVECGEGGCDLLTLRKDVGDGCLHKEIECEDCEEPVIGKDLDHHRRASCPNRYTQCPHCAITLLVCDTSAHTAICPDLTISCSGSNTGCPVMQPRRLLSAHIDICPFARLAPLITSQSTRIQALEDENALLRRKVNAFPSPTLPPMTPHDLPPLPEPTYTNSPRPDNFALTSSNETQSIELQTHMITSYESLRSDIDRLSASMSELDARQSVLVMNESLRVKDDFAHLNAVIGSMRVQLHWLMSHRLQNQQQQQQHQPQHQARATPSAGPSTGVGGGGRGPPGRGDDAAGIVRRLSDTLRQETKL